MKHLTLYALLLLTLLFGCNKKTEPIANEPRTDEAEAISQMKIAVFKNGKVKIEGAELSIDDAIAKIQSASGTEIQTLYYREAGQEDPHPNAMKIIAAIAEAKLPITLSTKPDFSTFVDMEGNEHQRNQ